MARQKDKVEEAHHTASGKEEVSDELLSLEVAKDAVIVSDQLVESVLNEFRDQSATLSAPSEAQEQLQAYVPDEEFEQRYPRRRGRKARAVSMSTKRRREPAAPAEYTVAQTDTADETTLHAPMDTADAVTLHAQTDISDEMPAQSEAQPVTHDTAVSESAAEPISVTPQEASRAPNERADTLPENDPDAKVSDASSSLASAQQPAVACSVENEPEAELTEDTVFDPTQSSSASPDTKLTFADFSNKAKQILEKMRQNAKLRRREQTRLRRANARRNFSGEANTDSVPLSAMDARLTLVRLTIAGILLLISLPLRDTAEFIVLTLALLIAMMPVLLPVARAVARGQYLDDHLFVLIGVIGAFLLGQRLESVGIFIIYGVGRIINDYIVMRKRASLSDRFLYKPGYASVVTLDGVEKRIAVREIAPGALLLVRGGERVPLDGTVLRGEGECDISLLTGEHDPVTVKQHDMVYAGSRFEGSLLLVRVTDAYEDCAVARIMQIQKQAPEHRAALESSTLEGVSRLVPFVVIGTVLLAILPPLFRSNLSFVHWIYRALMVLVICSPEALLISVPLAFSGGMDRLAQKGIYAKGSQAVEQMAELRTLVFNKTGTLTEGCPRVKYVHHAQGFNEQSCLVLAAAAEQTSRHVVARALLRACGSTPPAIQEAEEFPGRGVRARVGNQTLLAGNRQLMISRGVKGVPDIQGTVVFLAYEGEYAGAIVLEDKVRSEAPEAMENLHRLGVLRTVMLTGDNEQPARLVAEKIGKNMDTVHANLSPEEKAAKMEFLMRAIPTDGTAGYVGDGREDIETLTNAEIGIAIGPEGTAKTADAANLLILSHNLENLPNALRICRKTHSIVLQNIVLVLAAKLIFILMSVIGKAQMWHLIAADIVLTILTVLNAARTQTLR